MKCIDLFSGCGGLSLGFQNAGMEILIALDSWAKAADVYNENFDHPCHVFDLSDEKSSIEFINNYSFDMIIGGPPCQDFSSAGKRDETLGRADLTYSFANIVESCRPRWFLMENVERIKGSHILKEVTKQLTEVGYGLSSVILDASYCGVPQARKRFFLIGQRGGSHNQLNQLFASKLAKKPMTMRDYFKDSLGIDFYYRHPRNYSRRGVFSIDEPSPTVRGVNRPIPGGYKKHPGDPKEIELETIRPLTTKERSFIQTFPETFVLKGSKTNLEQMIGNAVPVNLAEFIASGILEYIEQDSRLLIQRPLFNEIDIFKIPTTALHRVS
jgi:DNA (cytosine-5)-methyltransferase 1